MDTQIKKVGRPVGRRTAETKPYYIPEIGYRLIPIAYGGAECDKHNNCFTCKEPVEKCKGGNRI